MRNRAKCKLCNVVIESFHATDYVECKCGEISVHEGASMKCGAKNYLNFLRVDDEGNEIIVKVENQDVAPSSGKVSKKELIGMLDEMTKNIESLPQHVLAGPVNHYDLLSLLFITSSLFKFSEEGDLL